MQRIQGLLNGRQSVVGLLLLSRDGYRDVWELVEVDDVKRVYVRSRNLQIVQGLLQMVFNSMRVSSLALAKWEHGSKGNLRE